MKNRRFKQLVYGIFYFLILFVIVYGIYNYLTPPPSCSDGIQNEGETGIDCGGPCAPCTSNLKPIALVGQVKILIINNTHISLLAQIQNQNTDFGAKNFDYTFNIYKNNQVLNSFGGNSFIYPGEIKYLIQQNISVSNVFEITRADLIIANPSWRSADAIISPKIKITNEKTEINNQALSVSGIVSNEGSFLFPQFNILAVFYDKLGLTSGAAETQIDNLDSNQSRSFIITYPATSNIDISATKIFTEVQFLK